jgi:hypothetical protein
VDIKIEEFARLESQIWAVSTGPSGTQITLAAYPDFCLSAHTAFTSETIHLWHCDSSAKTYFRYDEAKKTISPASAAGKCVALQTDGTLALGACDYSSNQQFSLPLNSKV